MVGTLRRPKRAAFALMFAALFTMFATNSDWGGDPESARGDGRYRPVLARGDGHMMFLMSRSIVFDRDLVYDNDLARFGDPWRQRRTATGRKAIPHPIGPPLLWAPVLASASGLALAANVVGAEIPTHGYTMFHQRIVFATSVVFGFLAVVLGAVVARRRLGGNWSVVYAAGAVLFGTSLTYYATYMPSYGHALDAFFSAAFLGAWALTIGDLRWRRFALLGALLGLSALIRTQGFGHGVVVALEVVVLGLRGPGDRRARELAALAARGLVALAVAVVVFSPQLIAWKLVYGEFVTSPAGPHFIRLRHPLFLELLFASRNGWLSTHPIAYAGVVGLLFVVRKAKLLGIGLALALLVQIWINASVYDWWAGASFGARRMCSMTFVIVVGLAALTSAAAQAAARVRRLPRLATHAFALCVFGWFVVWNISGVERLRSGKAAGHPVAASCCGRLPAPMRTLATPIYKAVGNPFSFPANALFALRHGVPLTRWDVAVGDYVYAPGLFEHADGSYRRHRSTFKINSPRARRYITRGFGPVQKSDAGKPYRWTVATRADVIVPILLPEAHVFNLELVAREEGQRVSLALGGKLLAERRLSAGTQVVSFTAPLGAIEVGSNVLTIRTELGESAIAIPTPANQPSVGVAIGALVLRFPPATNH